MSRFTVNDRVGIEVGASFLGLRDGLWMPRPSKNARTDYNRFLKTLATPEARAAFNGYIRHVRPELAAELGIRSAPRK